jgi:multidrug resistance efflux pump
MCQQSFKEKCTEFGDSLKEIRDNVPEQQQQLSQAELKDVYGGQLDGLNAKYERLLSLFQKHIDDAKDIDADREVSHCRCKIVCHLHGSL